MRVVHILIDSGEAQVEFGCSYGEHTIDIDQVCEVFLEHDLA